MTNPFATGPQAAPAQISDIAAQQFGAPAQAPQQQAPNAFAQGQHPAQQAQQDFAPHAQQFAQAVQQSPAQTLSGAPWTPQQHQQNVPQAFTQTTVPAPQTPAQGLNFAQLDQQAAPAAQPSASPFAGVTPQGGGGFDPAMFNAPASSVGTYPKVRDLDGRLCLFHVRNRNSVGTAYGDATKQVTNFLVNVAVLDGGPLYSSPSQEDATGTPVLVTETLPYVVPMMTIGQIGLQNRLRADFVRGRVVRIPKGKTRDNLLAMFPGMEDWQALTTWLRQNPANVNQLGSGTYFWGIVPDESDQANQLVAAFAQHPAARELMA